VLETESHVESENSSKSGAALDRLGMVKMGTLQIHISRNVPRDGYGDDVDGDTYMIRVPNKPVTISFLFADV
jgi:hypothetical protein